MIGETTKPRYGILYSWTDKSFGWIVDESNGATAIVFGRDIVKFAAPKIGDRFKYDVTYNREGKPRAINLAYVPPSRTIDVVKAREIEALWNARRHAQRRDSLHHAAGALSQRNSARTEAEKVFQPERTDDDVPYRLRPSPSFQKLIRQVTENANDDANG